MKRVLLTGMSGTGKSTLTRELAARGYRAVDLDTADWSEWVDVPFDGDPSSPDAPAGPDRDWRWRDDRVRDLLDHDAGEVLFVSGCAENMRPFLARFDRIVLLTTPDAVLVQRLSSREPGTYGTTPVEVARILAQVRAVEPLLRRVATDEIDTSVPMDLVVSRLVRIGEEGPALRTARPAPR